MSNSQQKKQLTMRKTATPNTRVLPSSGRPSSRWTNENMNKRWKKIIAWISVIFVIAIVVIKIIDIQGRPKRVASILNIPSLPTSARVIDCKDALIPTDVVVTCSIELEPKEFPNLLRGYKFVETPTKETSHTAVSTKVGPEFPVTTEFTAEPKEFKHTHIRGQTYTIDKQLIFDTIGV